MLVLVLLFLLVNLFFGRKRLQRDIEKKSKASFSVFTQTQSGRLNNLFNNFKQARQTRAPGSTSLNSQTQRSQLIPANSDVLCPNCGQKVPNNAAFCPNCVYSLLPDAQGSRPTVNISPASIQPMIAASPPRTSVQPRPQPQQPAQVPKMQDDPAIQAALQRLWDKAG